MPFTTDFAKSVFLQKYSKDGIETWADTCKRVVGAVCKDLSPGQQTAIYNVMLDRKFIPGGRYLYAAGREWQNFNNCFLLRAGDSSEGWSDLMGKATAMLMAGGGIGVDYSALRPRGAKIKRKGGESTGPLAAMKMVNEIGRYIMQGGNRRSAIFASLNWDHADVKTFLKMKDYPDHIKALKAADFTFPTDMELTNISVGYDTKFFDTQTSGNDIWTENCRQAFRTAEPGMSFNYGKDAESLRNACVAGGTEILTENGYQRIDTLIGQKVVVWNGFEWSEVTPKITGRDQRMVKVTLSDGRQLTCTEAHDFHVAVGYTGETRKVKADSLEIGQKLIKHDYPIIREGVSDVNAYSQGFISGDGMDGYDHAWLYEPKFMCEKRLVGRSTGNTHYNVNGTGKKVFRFSFTPKLKSYVPFELDLQGRLDWFAGLLDSDGTELREGGSQIASVDRPFLLNVQKMLSTVGIQSKVTAAHKSGLRAMPDGNGGSKDYYCQDAFRLLVGAVQMQQLKQRGLRCERMTFNKKPQRDASQFVRVVATEYVGVEDVVYCFNEPKRHLGCFDGVVTGQCCEVVSSDDSDKCNLGTVWMNRCTSLEDFHATVRLSTLFLLCGGIHSDVPTAKVKEVGTANNRIGLGLGGMHEWLLTRGMAYEVTDELHDWLTFYVRGSEEICSIWSKKLGVSYPKGIRAVAPTGSIGILAETTTGIEPLFCKAYKRRYFKDGQWLYQYVVDGSVSTLLSKGVKMEDIKDSYDLTFEQRVSFQADVQQYVDMAISSTCNMAPWNSESNNESNVQEKADTLFKYAKRLRGFTCYPDGSRSGQPLERCSIEEALKHVGNVYTEHADICDISGKGGSCGS